MKNDGFSPLEAMVIRDTVDSLASSCPPPTPRRLAHGRHRHPAHGAGDLDTGPGPWSDLPVSDAAGPSPRCPHGHGAALGTMARRAAPAGAEVLLRQWPLHPSPLDRAAGPAGRPLGAADAAARAVAGAHRYGASGNGRGVPEPSPGLGRQSPYPPAPAASSAPPGRGHPSSARCRRLGRSERSARWDHRVGKHTVFRALRTKTLPARKRRTDRGRSRLTPDTPDLLERWNAGCRDALRLFREIQPQGYPGSDATVARDAQRLRQAQGEAPRPRRRRHPLPLVTAPPHRALTPRRATWLVLRRPERRTPEEQERLTQLTAQDAPLADAIALAQDVAQLVRQRQPEQLDPWLARAAVSPLIPLQRFAKGLRDDDAVKAGVTLPWSHGPVEGHINRLKTLTRQMFGRASLELLQRRLMLAA